jgi:hypothetical protein
MKQARKIDYALSLERTRATSLRSPRKTEPKTYKINQILPQFSSE